MPLPLPKGPAWVSFDFLRQDLTVHPSLVFNMPCYLLHSFEYQEYNHALPYQALCFHKRRNWTYITPSRIALHKSSIALEKKKLRKPELVKDYSPWVVFTQEQFPVRITHCMSSSKKNADKRNPNPGVLHRCEYQTALGGWRRGPLPAPSTVHAKLLDPHIPNALFFWKVSIL